jgi:iron complex outermembrane receptor protein
VLNSSTNGAVLGVQGIDFSVYTHAYQTEYGSFKLSLDSSYALKAAEGDDFIGKSDGEGRNSVHRFKANAGLDWQMNEWRASWKTFYKSKLTSDVAVDPITVGAVIYHDMQLTYRYEDFNSAFTLGVNNVFNTNPDENSQARYNLMDPTYRVWDSREMYFRVTTTF